MTATRIAAVTRLTGCSTASSAPSRLATRGWPNAMRPPGRCTVPCTSEQTAGACRAECWDDAVKDILPRCGEKRPADAIGNAIMIAKIATGEIEDITTEDGKNAAAVALGRMGGKARAKGMSAKRRKEIAKKAAEKRWKHISRE